jgi:hypothetical protein
MGKRIIRRAHFWSDSRSQISNRIEDGLVEVIQLSPLQPSVKRLTHIGASLAKVDVVLIIGHRILMWSESQARPRRVGVGKNIHES